MMIIPNEKNFFMLDFFLLLFQSFDSYFYQCVRLDSRELLVLYIAARFDVYLTRPRQKKKNLNK